VRPLAELVDEWVRDLEADHDVLTVRQYRNYAHSRFVPFFGTLDGITAATAEDYWRGRLRVVIKRSVRKELSALRGLLEWAHGRGYIGKPPLIEGPSRRATGTPDTTKRHKLHEVEVSRADVEAMIHVLPERSPGARNRNRGFLVRDRFAFAWETGLRPATLDELRGEDYQRDTGTLRIRDVVDKNRYARELPLTPRARAILDRVCPATGLVFGRHDARQHLRAAARAVLPPDKARQFSIYDVRHGRLTDLCEHSSNLPGVAFLSGHLDIGTLSSRYVHPSARAAREVLSSLLSKPEPDHA
jgi:site-specific recombinase XerC